MPVCNESCLHAPRHTGAAFKLNGMFSDARSAKVHANGHPVVSMTQLVSLYGMHTAHCDCKYVFHHTHNHLTVYDVMEV